MAKLPQLLADPDRVGSSFHRHARVRNVRKPLIDRLRCGSEAASINESGLFQSEWVFGFYSAEFADRKSAAWVALQVFDVGSGTCVGLFQRLHRAMAVFAAHRLAALGESFV
jgi:hypothetical protein